MAKRSSKRRQSAFEELGFKQTVIRLVDEVQALYLADEIPWVVGYSGGKDSTATLQLVWLALSGLNTKERVKPVHVISTDTLVENPVVATWVAQSLATMGKSAEEQSLPITPHRLTPKLADSFWVNLIGRGYPAPRPRFRWCTYRLKIQPSNDFISSVVRESGEAILVLGIRKAESSVRANLMGKLEVRRVREKLSPNASLPNSLVYSPIEDWSNDDVWTFLMQTKNPWDINNKYLLTMYQGASEDGECPLVIDTSTPSCGDSRFGCWVCTLVDEDKSMAAMIQNDEEKEWMLPLLELRNELGTKPDRHLRDFRRMTGVVQIFKGHPIPGPYKQAVRDQWLRKVLEAQQWIREHGPEAMKDLELISLPELHEIRRIWVVEKHELEDRLPHAYQEILGEPFPGQRLDDNRVFGEEEMHLLKEACDEDEIQFQLIRELLDIERSYRVLARRAGLFDALEQAMRRGFYADEEDASDRALRRAEAIAAAKEGEFRRLALEFAETDERADTALAVAEEAASYDP